MITQRPIQLRPIQLTQAAKSARQFSTDIQAAHSAACKEEGAELLALLLFDLIGPAREIEDRLNELAPPDTDA